MWPLFVLYVSLSWVPVLALYVAVVGTLNRSTRFLKHLFRRKGEQQRLEDAIVNATSYEEWEAAGLALDAQDPEKLKWKNDDTSPIYRHQVIKQRVDLLTSLVEARDVEGLSWRLGQFPVRHFCNITDPRLFTRLRVGTKTLIEKYIDVHILAAKMLAEFPCEESDYLTEEVKLESFKSPRVAFGHTALLLQAGSIFGLCHVGVVKELLHRDLLPSTIAGTKSGAIVAALIGVHSDEDLFDLLEDDNMNLEALTREQEPKTWRGIFKRVSRLLRTGSSMRIEALQDCLHANIGDITFEEAYYKTRRSLSITITCDEYSAVPNLLNHMTSPNVVVWSAAIASIQHDANEAIHKIRVKTKDGAIIPWDITLDPPKRSKTENGQPHIVVDTTTPLNRLRELFNVNHFIISQARPYLASLLDPSFERPHYPGRPDWNWIEGAVWLFSKELKHRIRQAGRLGLAPSWAMRFVDDELMEESTIRRQPKGDADIIESITLVPELAPSDFQRLVHNPAKAEVDYWVQRGRRSVWPAVAALEVRCALETVYEYYYNVLKGDGGAGEGCELTPVVTPSGFNRRSPLVGQDPFIPFYSNPSRRSSLAPPPGRTTRAKSVGA